MTRAFFFLASLMLAAVSVATAGLAADLGRIDFALFPASRADQVRFVLSGDDAGRDSRHHQGTSMTIPLRDLSGLPAGGLFGPAGRPLQFALVRDAGRADCTGTGGGGGRASGACRFTADPAFLALLHRAGVPQPSAGEAFAMLVVDVRRDLVAAIGANGFPAASAGELTGLAALKVDAAYISELARRGYRPDRLSDLTAFKALGVTPAYIDGLVHAGFGRLTPNSIVQLKALNVSPEWLAQLRAAGYAPFRAEEVVQLRALGVTAADYRRFRQDHGTVSVDKLVEAKALGLIPGERSAAR